MPSKSKGAETGVVSFRLEPELLKRIEAHAKRLADAHPGLTVTRVGAVRSLLLRALDEAEAADKRRKG